MKEIRVLMSWLGVATVSSGHNITSKKLNLQIFVRTRPGNESMVINQIMLLRAAFALNITFAALKPGYVQ